MHEHIGQSKDGKHDLPERVAGVLADSLDHRQPTIVVRARTGVTVCGQLYLRDPPDDVLNHKDQSRDARPHASWRGVPVFMVAKGA